MKMYIKDTYSGKVREYGANHHDSLRISNDGTYLTYEHLQCGDGSVAGHKEHSGYLFCDNEGRTPEEDEVLCRHGADAYFNIGGFDDTKVALNKIRAEIEQEHNRLSALRVDETLELGECLGLKMALKIIDKYKKSEGR